MTKGIVVLCLSLALSDRLPPTSPPQDKVLPKWGIPPDTILEFSVLDNSSGKPVSLKNEVILVSAAELATSGAPRITPKDYWEIPLVLALTLPEKPLKVGEAAKISPIMFDNRLAIPEFPPVRPIQVRGEMRLKTQEKVDPNTNFVLDGVFELFEVTRQGTELKVGARPIGSIRTSTVVNDGIPRKFSFNLNIPKGQEVQASDLRGSCRTVKMQRSWTMELREPAIRLSKEAIQQKVNDAVDRAAKWLKSQFGKDGTLKEPKGEAGGHTSGVTALGYLALLHSGVSQSDSTLTAAFEFLSAQKPSNTYDVALFLFALEAKFLMKSRASFDELSEEKVRAEISTNQTKQDGVLVQRLADFLVEKQEKAGYWAYPGPRGGKYDHSNTIYAILGLKSASRCGAKIPTDVWRRAARHLQSAQLPGGEAQEFAVEWTGERRWASPMKGEASGWTYFTDDREGSAYGTIVCGGISALLACQSELSRAHALDPADAKSLDESIRRALLWLGANFSTRNCPPGGMAEGCFWIQYLFGLERAMVYLGISKLRAHDWYWEGALRLISVQQQDGSWTTGMQVVDTAFALLFLKKSFIPVETKGGK